MRPWMLIVLPLAVAACEKGDERPGLRDGEVLLQVAAEGRSEVTPDQARLTVGFSNTGPTARAASGANSATMQRVAAALSELGVKPEDLQTRNLAVQRITYGPQRGQYRAENLVEVRIRNVAQAGAAVAAATEAGGNVVAGPDLRVSNPDAADNAAYANAYKAARARAEAYAKAADLKVKRVITIRDGGLPSEPIPYVGNAMAVEVQAVAPRPPVSAGRDERRATVRVDFALGS
jgi:uncharacterized protein YggE